MKILWQITKNHLLFFILAPLLMAVEVYCDLYQPTLMARIIDVGVAGGDWALVLALGGKMFLVAIIGLLGGFGCLFFSAWGTAAAGYRLREILFDHIQTFSFQEIDAFQPATLITRLTNDVSQIQSTLLSGQRILIRAPLLFFGGLAMAFTLSPRLSLVFLAAVPVILLAIAIVLWQSRRIFRQVQDKLDNLNQISRETLLGIKTIKAFAAEERQHAKMQYHNDALLTWNIKAQRLMIILSPLVTFVVNITIIAILWQGGRYVVEGTLEVGKIMAFITYILQIMQALLMSMMIMMSLSRASASLERVNDVLNTAPTIAAPPTPLEPQGYDLCFDHVYFKYPNHTAWVLEDISFTVKAGEKVGILGATGSGKSSLVNLIPRLYDVNLGKITLGGVDIRQMNPAKLRAAVAMVLQKDVLFSGTIESNLRFGSQNAKAAEMQSALASAVFADNPLDKTVAQQGGNFSGGQKQRLAIARALLKKAPILILDDAASALDFATEAKLRRNLKTIAQNAAVIFIAQRISTIKDCDVILLLDKGRIIARGTHSELLAASTIYQEIYQSQSEEGLL